MTSPIRGLSLAICTYTSMKRRGVNSHAHLYCILHAKMGVGVEIGCKDEYIINGRALIHVLLVVTDTIVQFLDRGTYNCRYHGQL